MGGQQSTPKQRKSMRLQTNVDKVFNANCDASAQSVQSISLKNTTVVALDGCKANFKNTGAVKAECNMDGVLEKMAAHIVETDKDVARRISEQREKAESAMSSVDDYSEIVNVKEELSLACGSHVRAKQTIEVIGGRLMCSGKDSEINFSNKNDVRAVCMRSFLEKQVDEMDTVEEEEEEDEDDDDTTTVVLIGGAGAVALLLVLLLSSGASKKNVPAPQHG